MKDWKLIAGRILREQREEVGDVLEGLQSKFGLRSPQTLGNWERGVQLPPESRLSGIYEFYRFEAHPRRWSEFMAAYQQAKPSLGPIEISAVPSGKTTFATRIEEFRKRAEAESADKNFLIHHVSGSGYLVPHFGRVQRELIMCAAAGITVAYFSLPGQYTWSQVHDQLRGMLVAAASHLPPSLAAEPQLADRIGSHTCLLHLKLEPPIFQPNPVLRVSQTEWLQQFAKDHLKDCSPEAIASLGDLVTSLAAPAGFFGEFLKFTVLITSPREVGDTGLASRAVPEQMQVEEVLVDFSRESEEREIVRWNGVPESDSSLAHFSGPSVASLSSMYAFRLETLRRRNLIEFQPILTDTFR